MDSYEATANIIENVKALNDDAEPEALVRAIIKNADLHEDTFEYLIKGLMNQMLSDDMIDDSPRTVAQRIQAVLPYNSELKSVTFKQEGHYETTIKPFQWDEQDGV